MPNIVDRGIFKEYTRTQDEQKLYDLEAKVNEQSQLINSLLSMINENKENKDSD